MGPGSCVSSRKRKAAVLVDRPAGQDAGELGHVGLGVAAVHAQRVQLHQLAGEVLVQAAVAALAGGRARADRAGVVEVDQHAGVADDGAQQVEEAAGDVRPDRLALEGPGEAQQLRAAGRDGEVVAPEQDQPLAERGRGPHALGHAGADLLAVDVERAHPELAAGLGRALARLAAGVDEGGDDSGRGGQRVLARQRSGVAVELGQEPSARVGGGLRQLARPGAEAEAEGGGDDVGRHAAFPEFRAASLHQRRPRSCAQIFLELGHDIG